MAQRARLVGMNHVAMEVGDIQEALDFYGAAFDFTLRGQTERMAFIDMGDQFIALAAPRSHGPDVHRHVGLVVDDLEAAREALVKAGAAMLPGAGVDFVDPWGNRIQVVEYRRVQFMKEAQVARGMGLELEKTPEALDELRQKGLAD